MNFVLKGVGKMGKRGTRELFLVVVLILILFQTQGFCSFYDQILADTRTLALGNSFAADPNSNFAFNPSVLGKRGNLELAHTFSSTPILELSSSFSTLRVGPVGFAYSKLVMDDVAAKQYKTQVISASFGILLSSFNVGTTLKRHEMSLGSEFDDTITTMNLAITRAIGAKVNAGVAIENILALQGEGSNAPAIEPLVRVGLNFNPSEALSFNLDLDTAQKTYLGLESTLYKGVKARAGFGDGIWSLGCGLSNGKLSSDYVYSWGGLSSEHIITIKLSL